MSIGFDLGATLVGMFVLMCGSAFFSASEAAMFSLKAADLRRVERQGAAGLRVQQLLSDPNRLLTAVLFWNLVINVLYFALVSMAGLQLSRNAHATPSLAVGFSAAALLALIFASEMLPKSLAVLAAGSLALWIVVPLSLAVRVLDPVMPALRAVTILSERLLWPGFQPEKYLEIADLERAVLKSTDDAVLQAQEQHVLRQLVSLSDLRVDEWMRPRSQLTILRPPVAWGDWGKGLPPTGYLLVAEEQSDEIALWLNLDQLSGQLPATHLEYACQPVMYVPWCATVADTFQDMVSAEREVTAVVNERGETIGVLTIEDLMETLFTSRGGRSERVFDEIPIVQREPNVWRVNGMTNLRRVAEHFSLPLPTSHSVTLAGWLEESCERLPQVGDTLQWGPYRLEVVATPEDEPIAIQVVRVTGDEPGATVGGNP